MKLAALCLCLACTLCSAQVPAIHWRFERSIQASNDVVGTPLPSDYNFATNTGQTPSYEFGRPGRGLSLPASQKGAIAKFNPGISSSFTVSFYAKVKALESTQPMRAVLWHEGIDPVTKRYIAGLAVVLTPTGNVAVSIGTGGRWVLNLVSSRTFGIEAWHHVALTWDGATYTLYVNGNKEMTKSCAIAPDWSSNVPTCLGAFYASGNPRYFLDGAIDELQFFQACLTQDQILSKDLPLEFRGKIIQDMRNRGIIGPAPSDESQLNTPSYSATSILRAYIASLYTDELNSMTIPFDPLNTSKGYQYCVYNRDYGTLTVNGVPVSANGGLYQRIRDHHVRGMCGSAGMILWAVYKAFGFNARTYDWMGGYGTPTELNYTMSHVLNEVIITETGTYCMQDATYNISGYVPAEQRYVGLLELWKMINPEVQAGNAGGASQVSEELVPFSNGGYSCYATTPTWPTPTKRLYYQYFQTPASVVSGYQN